MDDLVLMRQNRLNDALKISDALSRVFSQKSVRNAFDDGLTGERFTVNVDGIKTSSPDRILDNAQSLRERLKHVATSAFSRTLWLVKPTRLSIDFERTSISDNPLIQKECDNLKAKGLKASVENIRGDKFSDSVLENWPSFSALMGSIVTVPNLVLDLARVILGSDPTLPLPITASLTAVSLIGLRHCTFKNPSFDIIIAEMSDVDYAFESVKKLKAQLFPNETFSTGPSI